MTLSHEVVLSYKMQVNCSITLKRGDSTDIGVNGYCTGKWKASVAVGNAFQASQDDFLDFPLNCDVVSDPMKAWKNGSALDLPSQSSPQRELMW